MKIRLAPTIIGLAGPIGSGKTTIARGLANALGCPIVSFGAYVRDFAERTGRENGRDTLQQISEQLLSSIGTRGLTRDVIFASGWNRNQSLVVDGIRHPEVVEALKTEVAPLPVVLVFLDVPAEIRMVRLSARDSLSNGDMERFDLHSTERDVGSRVKDLADVVVKSNTSVEQLVAAVIASVLQHQQR